MNEQIKELAEKAGIEFTYDPTEIPIRAFIEAWENELEFFAQSLIQEVCKLIEPDEEWRKDASWGYIGGEEGVHLLDGAISTIKGHFGVQS